MTSRPIPVGGETKPNARICGDPLCFCHVEPADAMLPPAMLADFLATATIPLIRRVQYQEQWAALTSEVSALREAVEDAKEEAERWRLSAFAPFGDNHHNAALCPYCTPRRTKAV